MQSVAGAKIEINKLDGQNWQTWKFMFTRLLKSYPGTLDVIRGTIEMPTHPRALGTPEVLDKFKKESNNFEMLDNTAQLILSANMTEDMLHKVMRFNTAKDMWDELAKLYDGATKDKSYDLCMKFFRYQKDSEHDMTTHISAVKSLFYDLNTELKGNDLPIILVICKILDTLPEQFFAYKSSWLLMAKQDRNIENLTIKLCAYERALINKAECNTNMKALVKIKCKYCGQIGHIIKKCHKWISDGRPPKNSNSGVNNMNLTIMSVEDTIEVDKNSWYVDNGATSHVTNRPDFFESFEYFHNNHTITTASGQIINAIGKGSTRLNADVKGGVESLLLEDVWYIPALQRNLFSVLAAQDKLQHSIFESHT
ncbi:hypothetical protein K1T71_003908 [Dendrolimus kikuchii]|uniref:Uncharacterized protein n=1 Tax=Dendrolimus kikuchii TaxID=765133 RepID=A0ACC1D9S0_9NEOP|nr:hypothetical protein K1T71_003908 [Dendrolimus kikuchii]